jgi:hypothetical protein
MIERTIHVQIAIDVFRHKSNDDDVRIERDSVLQISQVGLIQSLRPHAEIQYLKARILAF